jgi:hypothetical protein
MGWVADATKGDFNDPLHYLDPLGSSDVLYGGGAF